MNKLNIKKCLLILSGGGGGLLISKVRLQPQRYRNKTMIVSGEQGNYLSENFRRLKKHGQIIKGLLQPVCNRRVLQSQRVFAIKFCKTGLIAKPVETKVWHMGIIYTSLINNRKCKVVCATSGLLANNRKSIKLLKSFTVTCSKIKKNLMRSHIKYLFIYKHKNVSVNTNRWQ
jgi:hypothetical protein